jgi:hypothetical protein
MLFTILKVSGEWGDGEMGRQGVGEMRDKGDKENKS